MLSKIVYLGVDDLDIDLFEGQYVVPEGMSYNSYVIYDREITVMDTVDARKADEWMQKLTESLCGAHPTYLVIQHLEPDHSGCLSRFVEKYPYTTLVLSSKAAGMLPQFVPNVTNPLLVVKEGDSLELGDHKLEFYMAPMVHWPEVMVTFERTEGILFSADGFGKFGALCNNDPDDWACEARRYYFNICGKYGVAVQALLKKAATLPIQTICPLHGPVLKENLSYYINLYNIWSSYGVESEGVFVAYASIHGNTAVAVEKVAEMLREASCPKVVVTDLCRSDIHEAVEDAFRYGKMILAASSYDGGVFTPMHNFLHILEAKAYQNRKVGIIENGSWAPSAAKTMVSMLSGMKNIEILEPQVTIRTRLTDTDIPALKELVEGIS